MRDLHKTVKAMDFADTFNNEQQPYADLDTFEISFNTDLKDNKSQSIDHPNDDTSMIVESFCFEDDNNNRNTSRSRRLKKGMSKRAFATKGRHIIQHNYHDHANDVIDFDEYTGESIGLEAPIKKKGGVAIPFPLKLHDLLDKVDEEGHQHVVSWQPHGRAFVVREPKTFVADLMPRFFRQTKLTSFQRQLNLYGFSRITRGPDAGGYYHELFLRGKPHLTRRMIRTKIKGTGYKAASNPACEPNFYNMSPVGQDMIDQRSNGSNSHFEEIRSFPIVTPTVDPIASNHGVHFGQSQKHSAPGDVTAMPLIEMPSMKAEKPFLKPRHHARAVKVGNEHFHYMESLNQSSLPDLPASSEDSSSRSSCTSSPVFFERISSEETLVLDSEEDPSQDPLAIFLAEMGGDFEDDIVFTSCECDEVKSEEIRDPSIYEV
jgi:hypothetical protein